MAESIISGVIVKLLEYIGKSTVEYIAPYFGGRRKLKELSKTMRLIQARLLDAERRGEGESEALVKEWLKRLKELMYRLEDLLEEVAMADERDEANEQQPHPPGKLTKHLCMMCSSSSSIKLNKKVAREANVIIEELNAIRLDMYSLNLRVLSFDEQRVRLNMMNGRQTHSFILEEEVVGRVDDRNVIVQMLLDAEESVSIITIIGIGGLGKTTLAQLAFNDEDVQHYFELKGWACISGSVSLEELARKILVAVSPVADDHDYQQLNLEQLQLCLREVVNDKRYLLVLDDMWDEDRERWLLMKRLLFGGKQGSKIIVTTRSGLVAQKLGTRNSYELGGLTEDESWTLFKSLAFKEGQQKRHPKLASIGKEIVKKCANVPLAIRTIAGLLYSKDTEQEWESFMNRELRMIEPDDSSIISTLKLSYDHLPSHLKQCFAYCSLFPKDYEIDKQCLIYLWMAQGFIRTSLDENESLEDIGHTYFMELLRRSFFQDVTRNEYDDIVSCKMHSLMNEMAQNVASDDCLLVETPKQKIADNICHLSLITEISSEAPSGLLAAKKARSILVFSDSDIHNIGKIFTTMRCLRSLDLSNNASCKSLPNSIEELKHLKYVRLGSGLESLPHGITKLVNLCTLDIRKCYKLKELPRDFNKLIRLRNLHNGERLIDLPPEFGQLTSLRALDIFIVGQNNGLDALASLNSLTGELKIRYVKQHQKAVSEARAANLKEKKIINLFLTWSVSYDEHVVLGDEEEEEVLKWLQPPPSVKRLKIWGWKGAQFPQWAMNEFPFLVSVSIRSCHRCRHLPSFSKLPHLRFLRLWDLSALEFIESGRNQNGTSATAYFPSLESLLLLDLPELKGWLNLEDNVSRQRNGPNNHQHSLSHRPFFPCLSELGIEGCPKLMSLPMVPKLESLDANEIHGKLLRDLLLSAEASSTLLTLKWLHIHSVQELVTLSINLFTVKSLTISECQELTHLIAESPTFLRHLVIDECCRLVDISSALQHVPLLEELEIRRCNDLSLGSDGSRLTPWQGLRSLRTLELWDIPKLELLPEGISTLTLLQKLKIINLTNLRALSEWLGNLSRLHVLEIRGCSKLVSLPQATCNLGSLQELRISTCPSLQRRCECPHGEDWPLIQHISDIYIG